MHNGEKRVSSTSGVGKAGQLHVNQWNKKIPSHHIQKINSKWTKDLNVRHDSIKVLEENIGKTLFHINCNNIFLDQSPKAKGIKAKINKWDLIKLKSFHTAKETIYKMKRPPSEWEKLFVNKGINIQNIQTAHTTQYQRNKHPNPKMGRRPK